MAVRKRHGTAVSFPSVALIVRMLDGDALDQVFGHIGRDGRAHLALWLVCKAFSARRPAGALETSANAMCDTPALLKWAIKIGLRPGLHATDAAAAAGGDESVDVGENDDESM